MKIKIIAFFAALFMIFSFNQSPNQEETSFVFRDKDKMVKLEFETKQLYLELEKPTEFKVSVENIDLKNSSIVGPGIQLTGKQGENYFVCKVTAHEKYLIENNLEIRIYHRVNDKSTLFHKFLIPIKR